MNLQDTIFLMMYIFYIGTVKSVLTDTFYLKDNLYIKNTFLSPK